MLAGHLASKFITEQNFNANKPEDLWHFTTKTVIECLRKNKEEFGRWLEEEKGIWLIVLGVDTEYYHNNFPIEEAYDFYSSLVKHNVWLYPPLSVVWFLHNKRKRDQCMAGMKLPQGWHKVVENNSWNDIVEGAKLKNHTCIPDNCVVCIVKESVGYAATGVYKLKKTCHDNKWAEFHNNKAPPAPNSIVSVDEAHSFQLQFGWEHRVLSHFFSALQTRSLVFLPTRVNLETGIYEAEPAHLAPTERAASNALEQLRQDYQTES